VTHIPILAGRSRPAGAHPGGIDAVLDLVGNPGQVTAASPHVRDTGTVISTAFGVTGELPARTASPRPAASLTTREPGCSA
jgi:threonine dehydrogenase-like Zn-dependent dehydrogenase